MNESLAEILSPEALFIAFDYHRSYLEDSNFDRERHYTVSTSDTVLQVGPYHGHRTLKFSESVGESGQVIAIEAHPENFQILKKNIKYNNLNNVTALNYAVSNEEGTVEFYESTRQTGKDNSLIVDNFNKYDENELNKIEADAIQIDTIVKELNISSVQFCTLTINRAEYQALQGMDETLTSGTNLVSIAAENKDKIVALLESYDYQTDVTSEFFAPVVYAWQ